MGVASHPRAPLQKTKRTLWQRRQRRRRRRRRPEGRSKLSARAAIPPERCSQRVFQERTSHGKADVEVGADPKSCRSTVAAKEGRQGCHRGIGIRGLQGIEEEWSILVAGLCKICRDQ